MSEGSTETTERPSGRLRPETGPPGEIHEMLADREYDEALSEVEATEPEGRLERDWLGYLQGLALLGARELDDAYESFRETAERITSASSDALEPDRHRVAAKCLKKMGWYHRRGDGHARAYAYHSMEYDLLDAHGSPIELHDAALSLDVVAYHLRTPRISRNWIERSIEAARDIEQEVDRRKALGLSWNNLTGTLCDLGDFEEAADTAEHSLEEWTAYEDLVGGDENRLIWAKHIYGDAYKRWGDALVEEGDEEAGLEKLDRAREVLEEAIEEAESREMEEDDLADIRGKLEGVTESIEAAGGDVEAYSGDDSGDEADDDAESTGESGDGASAEDDDETPEDDGSEEAEESTAEEDDSDDAGEAAGDTDESDGPDDASDQGEDVEETSAPDSESGAEESSDPSDEDDSDDDDTDSDDEENSKA